MFKKLNTLQQVELDMKMRRLHEKTLTHEARPYQKAKAERRARQRERFEDDLLGIAMFDAWMATRDW